MNSVYTLVDNIRAGMKATTRRDLQRQSEKNMVVQYLWDFYFRRLTSDTR